MVDFLGSFQEFAGPLSPFGYCHTLPELSGALSFRFDSNLPLLPKVIPIEDLKSYDTGRQHLGTLVKLVNVQLGPDAPSVPDWRRVGHAADDAGGGAGTGGGRIRTGSAPPGSPASFGARERGSNAVSPLAW